jgi:hypothetical protein
VLARDVVGIVPADPLRHGEHLRQLLAHRRHRHVGVADGNAVDDLAMQRHPRSMPGLGRFSMRSQRQCTSVRWSNAHGASPDAPGSATMSRRSLRATLASAGESVDSPGGARRFRAGARTIRVFGDWE